MQNKLPRAISLLAMASWLALPALAQTVVPPASPTEEETKTINLSPFTVSAGSDTGYRAKESLEGSRLRISLDDVSVPMDVITPEMLEDLNITRQEDLFDVVSNMEDRGDSFLSGVYESGASYRIRGFVGVTSLRNFARGSMSFDSYNSTRFIASKGPNSILFGAGPGGGSVSFFTKRYEMGARDQTTVRFSADDFGSLRGEFNFTKTLIPKKLGIHFAIFNDREKFEITPSYEHRYGHYLTAGYRPLKNTLINASFETRTEHVYRPASTITTIIDNYSAWLWAGSPATLTTGLGTVARGGLGNSNFNLLYPNGTTLNNQTLGNYGLTSYTTSRPTVINGVAYDLGGTSYGTTRLGTAANAFQRNFPANIWPADRGPTGLNGGAEVGAKAIDFSIEQKVTDNFYLMLAAGKIDSTRLLIPNRTRALSIDSNYYLPDRTLNPNYGKYFLETGMGTLDTFRDTDTITLTAAYELDLEKRLNKFLGKHNFALMYSDVNEVSQTIRQRMTLVKTPTNSNYQPTTLAADALIFRDYVDPFKGQTLADYRSVMKTGYEAGGYRWELVDGSAGAGGWSRSENLSYMAVIQSSWLKNRVITNYGWRKEEVDLFQLSTFTDTVPAGSLPKFYKPYTKAQAGNTALLQTLRTNDVRPTVFPTEPWESVSGVAENMGLIVRVTPTIAFVGNRSNNLTPSVGRVGVFGVPLPSAEGESEDYGVRFNLFSNKMRIEYTNYTTSVTNQTLQTNQLSIPEDQANDLWQMMIQRGLKTVNVFQDYSGWDNRDFVSNGHEITLSGSPVRALSARVAISYNKQIASNIGSSFMPWWRANVSEIEAFVAANPLVRNTLNATSLTAAETLQSAKNELLTRDAREGIPNINANLWAVKALAKYSFTEGRLKGNEVGTNIAWRSPTVTSYFLNPDGTNNLDHPYHTEETMFVHGFWTHTRKLKIMGQRVTWRFQVNVNNLFDKHKLVERNFYNLDRTNFDSATISTGYNYNVGRTFSVTNSFSF